MDQFEVEKRRTVCGNRVRDNIGKDGSDQGVHYGRVDSEAV